MTFDFTELFLALIGLLATVVSVYLIPNLKLYLTKLIGDKQLSLLIKIACSAVQLAEEDLWKATGEEKRVKALAFVKQELNRYNITFDETIINAYISSAVEQCVRSKKVAKKV